MPPDHSSTPSSHAQIVDIGAVLFDMDGTLVDSEHMTERAVAALLAGLGIADHGLDPRRFHGVTWASIAAAVGCAHPSAAEACTAEALHRHFHAQWVSHPPPLVPGARAAIEGARQCGRTAIVTSSRRPSVELLLKEHGLEGCFDAIVTAEDITRSKPDPEPFLTAATRLGVAPQRCLVFEDSLAGLTAARDAGMFRVAVTHSCADPAAAARIATMSVRDHTQLPEGFFDRACAPLTVK